MRALFQARVDGAPSDELAVARREPYGERVMVTRQQSRMLRRARKAAAPLAAALLAVVMLLGVVRAGARYFYCPMMHAVIDAPCCDGDARSGGDPNDPTDSAEVRSRDCCEAHMLRQLPRAAVSPSPTVSDAPLLAVVPPVTLFAFREVPVASVSRFAHEDRAGPRALARHRAELMVFLN